MVCVPGASVRFVGSQCIRWATGQHPAFRGSRGHVVALWGTRRTTSPSPRPLGMSCSNWVQMLSPRKHAGFSLTRRSPGAALKPAGDGYRMQVRIEIFSRRKNNGSRRASAAWFAATRNFGDLLVGEGASCSYIQLPRLLCVTRASTSSRRTEYMKLCVVAPSPQAQRPLAAATWMLVGGFGYHPYTNTHTAMNSRRVPTLSASRTSASSVALLSNAPQN